MLQASNDTPLFAEIIIPLTLPQNYTWLIPFHLQESIQIGSWVEVSLRNKKYAGIVKHITATTPPFNSKPIISLLAPTPILFPIQLQLWTWMANYYVCTEGEIMSIALPSYLKLRSKLSLIYIENMQLDVSLLTDKEYILYEALSIKKELSFEEISNILFHQSVNKTIQQMVEMKIAYRIDGLVSKYKAKTISTVSLTTLYQSKENIEKLLQSLAKKEKHAQWIMAFLALQQKQTIVTMHELQEKANQPLHIFKTLIKKEIFAIEKKTIEQITPTQKIDITFKLSTEQKKALQEIKEAFITHQVVLLHGVTGSGKTEIYIQLIAEYIVEKKQVLYLVPEIALTTQLIQRLERSFGGHVAVYHSKLSHNERLELWQKIRKNEVHILIGPRSALLLPFIYLSFIIVDEEHDASFKQADPAPRYHARDTAIYYASLLKAKILLGSATPSIESFYHTQTKKYALVSLLCRYNHTPLPNIFIVDTKKDTPAYQENTLISFTLKSAIEVVLSKKKQVLLFQNRRGYTPYIYCSYCGYTPQCKYCNVTVTYHKNAHVLSCHYCGSQYAMITNCPACNAQAFQQKKAGTEKIEEKIKEMFPQARVLRIDIDTAKGKQSYQRMIQQIENRQVDVIVGTQMISKGLDFEHLALIGIIDADALLQFPHFRVNERAFQMLEQVSGRSGRKREQGTVILQTLQPHLQLYQWVRHHQFTHFYASEINSRKQFHYPPFCRLVHIQCKHKNNAIAKESIYQFVKKQPPIDGVFIFGPTQPSIDKIKNNFIWEVLFKAPTQALHITKQHIQKNIQSLSLQELHKQTHWIINVDPI